MSSGADGAASQLPASQGAQSISLHELSKEKKKKKKKNQGKPQAKQQEEQSGWRAPLYKPQQLQLLQQASTLPMRGWWTPGAAAHTLHAHLTTAGPGSAAGSAARAAPENAPGGEEASRVAHFVAVFLFEDSVARLLRRVAPRHTAIHADHVTLAYRPAAHLCMQFPLGFAVPLFVRGAASDARCQAVAVELPSWLPCSGGCVPHVTVSVGEGVAPFEAAKLVQQAQQGAVPLTPIKALKLLHGACGAHPGCLLQSHGALPQMIRWIGGFSHICAVLVWQNETAFRLPCLSYMVMV
jgi:hypothetical protein